MAGRVLGYGFGMGLLGLTSCGAEILLGVHGGAGAVPGDASVSETVLEAGDTTDGAGDRDAATGCDADLLTSPTSCGACGHDCGGASCNGGLCAPVLLATGLDGPLWIDTDGTDVFWSSTGGPVSANKPVQRTSTLGGALSTLLPGDPGRLAGVHVDGPFVFAAHRTPTTFYLQRLGKTDGAKTEIGQSSTGQPQAVTTDATGVYVALGDVRRFAKTDLSAPGTPVGGPFVEAWGLALDGASLFVTDRTAQTVSVVDIATTTTTSLATGQGNVGSVTFDSAHVYFVARDRLTRVPKAGGATEIIAAGFGESLGVVVDGPTVYWTAPTSLLSAPIGGGPTRSLASGFGKLGHLAQDAHFLYFPDFANGTVHKLAKPPK